MTQEQVYGIRPVIEALNEGRSIQKVYLQKGISNPLFRELESAIKKSKVSSSFVPIQKLDRLTPNNHQGVVALISPVDFRDFDILMEEILEKVESPIFLMLDQITDVRNFGAIIRTAECSGVNAIIVPKTGSASINGDTIKTSAGAAFKVPIAKVDHLKDAVFYFQSSGIKTVGASEKAEKLIYETDLSVPLALVMGAEDKGISPSLLKMLDEEAKIPMQGEIGSLNVSVACGAFLYEMVRQRLP